MNGRVERVALRTAVFMAGALLMALEIAAFRIIGKTFGAALRETTAVISVFLAAMSLGYWAGGRVGDRWPNPTTLATTLFAAAMSLLVVPWVDAFLSPQIASSALPLYAHAFLATTILFAVPAFLFAATSPIAIRLFTTRAVISGSTAGSISAISTAGSIFGSILTAFFLIDWLASITRTVECVAAGACVASLLVLVFSAHTPETARARRVATAVVGSAVVLILTAAFMHSTFREESLLRPLPGTKIVFVGDSPYHRVTVRERQSTREILFNFAIQTRMRIDDPNGPGLAYADALHLGPLLRPRIRRVLLIGLGGGTMPKQFLRFYPEATIDVVEIDPLVVSVARRWFAVPTDPRLNIHVSDGRIFLDRSAQRWDLIVIDAYTTSRYGDTIPSHLTTREFFEKAAAHLSEDGILHFHCAFTGSELIPALERTLRSVYPFVARTEGEILASRRPLELRHSELLASAKNFGPAVLPHFADAIHALKPSAPSQGPLLTDDYAPVDTLLRPR
jgi:spermidine synthase